MLISESAIKYNTRTNLLESMPFINIDVNNAALVPVVESVDKNGYMIDLDDIFTFAESQNIDDLGYATSLICESNQINPNDIIFSIDETSIIADDNVAYLVEAMLDNGINVYAKPLSTDHPVSILGEAYLDHFFETGDISLFETFLNGEDYILNEYTLSQFKSGHKEKLYDLVARQRQAAGDNRKTEEIIEDMKKNNNLMKHAAYFKHHDADTEAGDTAEEYNRRRKIKAGNVRRNLQNRDYRLKEFEKTILPPSNHGTATSKKDIIRPDKQKGGTAHHVHDLYGPHMLQGVPFGQQTYPKIEIPNQTKSGDPKNLQIVKHSGGGARPSTPQSGFKLNFEPEVHKSDASAQAKSISSVVKPEENKSDTSKPYQIPASAKQQTEAPKQDTTPKAIPQAAQTDANKIKNMADSSKWTDKPKEWYAAAIAWLHKKATEFTARLKKDRDNAPFWKKLIGYITQAIANLTAKKNAA